MSKLKIDLKLGILEVEGEEAFIKAIYEDYKDRLSTKEFISASSKNNSQDDRSSIESSESLNTTNKKSVKIKETNKRKESYTLVTSLNLLGKDGSKSLKEFYDEKAPSNAQEKNAVFVYYLERLAKVTQINANHVYTCYKNVGEKVPGALKQSLLDTSSRKGWLDTKSMENITVPTLGENLIEHTLGKKDDKK